MENIKKIFGNIGKFILYILELILIIYFIVITTFLLFRNKYGYTEIGDTTFVPLKIDTAENIKDGKNGNLLVVKKTYNIKDGDLIYYYVVENERYIIKSDYVKSSFKGDNNILYTLDDERGSTVISTRVLGKYANQYPNYGTIFSVLTSKFGFLIFVLLPIMCLFIYQLYSLIIILKYENVELSSLEDDVKKEKSIEKKNEDNKIEEKKPVEEKKEDKLPEEDIEIL